MHLLHSAFCKPCVVGNAPFAEGALSRGDVSE
jgi:hypothetical protein